MYTEKQTCISTKEIILKSYDSAICLQSTYLHKHIYTNRYLRNMYVVGYKIRVYDQRHLFYVQINTT